MCTCVHSSSLSKAASYTACNVGDASMAEERLLGPIKERRIIAWSSAGRVSRLGGDDILESVQDT